MPGGRAKRGPRGRILVSLLALLFAVGVVPLLWTSYKLVSRSREILELDQKSIQLDKARSLSQQVAVYVRSIQSQITAIARTLEVGTAPEQFTARVNHIREAKALERSAELGHAPASDRFRDCGGYVVAP
jgi:hypothetical protein